MGILLSTTNLADAGSLTVPNAATDMAASALLTPQIYDVWRSSTFGASSLDIDVDLGASSAINVVAIGAPRDGYLPTASCTLRLTASTSSQSGTDALDTGTAAFSLEPWGVWGWRSVAGITARYLRLRITGTVNDSYVQLGRVWVGPALITTYAPAPGVARGGRDPGASGRAGYTGVRYGQQGRPYRQLRMDATLSSAEAATLRESVMAVGTTGQVFVAEDDDALGDGMFGGLDSIPAVTQPYPSLLMATIQVEEDA